jgi:hypothetical protein
LVDETERRRLDIIA